MAQALKFSDTFGRVRTDGNINILYAAEGDVVTSMDANVYPVGSVLSTRYERPEGIVLTRADAESLGIQIGDYE
jgi:hypothetical protein